jgi:hypothetical protein
MPGFLTMAYRKGTTAGPDLGTALPMVENVVLGRDINEMPETIARS